MDDNKGQDKLELLIKQVSKLPLTSMVTLLSAVNDDMTDNFYLIVLKIRQEYPAPFHFPNYFSEPELVLFSTTSDPDYEFVADVNVTTGEVSPCYGGQQTYDEKRLLLHWKTCPLDNPLAKAEAYYEQQYRQQQQQQQQ